MLLYSIRSRLDNCGMTGLVTFSISLVRMNLEFINGQDIDQTESGR